MQNAVHVFKGSINEIQNQINEWAEENAVTILSTAMCYDVAASSMGQVFVIVVYTRRDGAAAISPASLDR